MKIAIGFSCYQSAEEIERSLTPWLPHISHVVAIDGRYQTPESPEMKKMNLPNYSTDETEEVLKKICGDKLIYEQFTASQMDKRQRYLDIAGDLHSDFLIVHDTDDFIHPDYQNWNKFNAQLEAVLKHWDDQIFKIWTWIPNEIIWSRQHNAVPSNYWMKYNRVHKDPGNQRYVLNHFTFTDKSITDKEINDWEFAHPVEPGLAPLENPLVLQSNIVLDGIRITTDRRLRTADQLAYGDGWAWQNMHEENWRWTIMPAAEHIGVRIPYPEDEYYFNEKGQRVIYLKKGKETIMNLVIKDGQVVSN